MKEFLYDTLGLIRNEEDSLLGSVCESDFASLDKKLQNVLKENFKNIEICSILSSNRVSIDNIRNFF